MSTPAPIPSQLGGRARRRLWWIFLAGVLLLGLLVYGPVYQFGFLNLDDELFVRDNPWLQMGWCRDSLYWAFHANLTEYSKSAEYWSPLTLLTRLADAQIYGMRAGPFHVTSLLIHLLNTVLLGLAFRVLTGQRRRSYLVALLFLVHPLNVEPVCWLSARKDLVSGTFFFCTLLAYGWYVRAASVERYLVLLAAYAACLMAKPMGVSVPFVLLILDSWPLRRWPAGPGWSPERTRLLAEKLPLLIMAGVAAALAVQSQQDWGALQGADRFSLTVRIENALISYATYFRRLFWPSDLALFYPHPGDSISTWQAVAAGLFLVAMTVAWWFGRRRWPMAWAGWLWFGLVLGPVIGLVQIGGQAMADRYAYLALIGPFAALTWGLAGVGRGRWRVPAAGVAIGLCAIVSARQVQTWRNNETAFTQALAVTKNNSAAHLNLGVDLIDSKRYDEAESHLRRAVELSPLSALAWNDLARVQTLLGRDRDAISSYGKALQINPDQRSLLYKQSLLFAGRLLVKQNDLRRAEAVFRNLNAIAPDLPQPFAELAKVYALRKQWKQAAEMWRAYLLHRPKEKEALDGLAEAEREMSAAATSSASPAPPAAATTPPSPPPPSSPE